MTPLRLLALFALPLLLTACVASGPRQPGHVTLGDDVPLIRGAATEAQARRLCGVGPSGLPTPPQELCMRDWMFGTMPNNWES
jgi:hypothetical protein